MTNNILIIGGGGYIGSRLAGEFPDAHTCDVKQEERTNHYCDPYANLGKGIIRQFDTIVCLAGNSSVQNSRYPFQTYRQNIQSIIELAEKMNSSQRLIYASSGSVYNKIETAAKEDDSLYSDFLNPYDFSKFTIDKYFSFLKNGNICGLRFGTVNGFSPNMRWELIVNHMFKDSQGGEIKISNPRNRKSILGMNDLVRAIEKLIEYGIKHPIYNLCSFNASVAEIADSVARESGAKIITDVGGTGYSYEMSNELFCKDYNFCFTDTVSTIYHDLKQHEI